MAENVNKKEENEFLKKNKESRCQTFAHGNIIPNSYRDNTLKEELIIEHVLQYKKEFGLTYDSKRELLLLPQNECQKYKFICTTVRPTKVPYPELYDYKKCAKFVSEFFEYEELNPPTRFPEYIPAPDNVVKWQIGDCFDLSIVLCSLLIGAGYNAYVIYGKAPRFITSKDETRLPPPEMPDDIRIIEPNLEDKSDNITNTIKDKNALFSKYDLAEKQEKEEQDRKEWEKEHVIDDDMPELERNDPFKNRRIHCWVMIRKCPRLELETKKEREEKRIKEKKEREELQKKEGKNEEENAKILLKEDEEKKEDDDKEIEEIFIEPSTGRIYTVSDNPYEKVDALFNNVNFYINLHLDKPILEVDWNFNKPTNWEYVMLDGKEETNEPAEAEEPDKESGDQSDGKPGVEQVKVNTQNSEILDMPPPWGNKITISLQKYNERSPTQTQVFFYEKTKVERFSPCSQTDGLVLKIYNYKDFARFILTSVEHRYRNRGDKLYKRIEYPYEHKSIDYYLPGQVWHWKQVEEVEASYKKIIFYPTNFETGLVYREEIFGEKILHKYDSRDDKVFERKVLLNKNSKEKPTSYRYYIDSPLYDNKILIYKFSQKTNRNPLLAPEEQILKLSYKFDKGTHIQVINHYGKGKILSKPDTFYFEDESSMASGDKDDAAKNTNNDRETWKRNIYGSKSKYIEDFKRIEEGYNKNYQLSIEYQKKIAENRRIPPEQNKALFERVKGELNIPILERSIFDMDSLLNGDDVDKDKNDYSGNTQSVDRISHYLKEQKERLEAKDNPEDIKRDIIQKFKEEKTNVTNALQTLLKDQVQKLQQKIDEFKTKDEHDYGKASIEAHTKEINDIQRKINIIYQRSHKHITKIMEELNELLEKMEQNFNPEQ